MFYFAKATFLLLLCATTPTPGEATCGECLPIMEGDDAFINARLWKTTDVEPAEYLGYYSEDYSTIFESQPGFIKFAATTTQDPSIFLFYDIFDTEENSKAARKVASESYDKYGEYDELLHMYLGEINWSGAPDDCIKGNKAGDYLSSRFFYDVDPVRATGSISSNYDVWKDTESFESYISSYAVDDTDESFFINTFNDEEDNNEATDLALSTTNLDATTALIVSTVGQVAFDFTCSGNNFEFDMKNMDDTSKGDADGGDDGDDATCMTIGEIVHSHPDLVHLSDIVNAVEGGLYAVEGGDNEKWTLFAPTDLGDALDGVSDDTALNLLLFHSVPGEALFSDDLPCISGDNLTQMANGINTRTLCDKDGPVGQKGGGNINGPADFVEVNIESCNGVVHIIDKVLLYPAL